MPVPNKDVTKTKVCTAWYMNLKTGVTSGKTTEGLSPISNDFCLTASQTTMNYRTFKNKFFLPNNNYEKTVNKMSDTLAYNILDVGPGGSFMRYWDRTVVKEGFSVSMDAVCDDPSLRLSNLMLAELNQQNASTLTSLAEMNRTANMVTSTATAIAGAIRDLRRGRLSSAMGSLGIAVGNRANSRYSVSFSRARDKDKKKPGSSVAVQDLVAQTWLTYSYGWKPLLNDIYSHAEALANAQTSHNNVVRRITKTCALEARKTSIQTVGSKLTLRAVKDSVLKRSAKMVLYYQLSETPLSPLLHFGIQNPMLVAWEVVPFSFVVDWFLPVGNYLESLTATAGTSFVKGTVTVKTNSNVEVTVAPGPVNPNGAPSSFQSVSGGGRYHKESFSIKRTVMSGFPSPSLPRLKDPRSITHAASAIALLVALRPKN